MPIVQRVEYNEMRSNSHSISQPEKPKTQEDRREKELL